MAFRNKEWHPPDRLEVGKSIKDRMSLSEISMDSLKEVLSYAQFSALNEVVAPDTAEDNDLAKDFKLVNAAYYDNIKKFAHTVSKTETVNIVLPVYNSLHLVRECISAVVKETHWPYHLTIVDDASDRFTNNELAKIVANYPGSMTLLTNKRNRGFSATVNRGVKFYESQSKYTCYLNSDVLVTPYWLTKMVMALNANPRNKIVNPVTNNTAVINVNMSPGYSYQNMNKALEESSARRYPEIMPTGFCFLFENSLIKTVGYLDEGYKSFGEETAMWMQTITYSDGKTFDRWRSVLADDTYVFHQRSASFATLGEEQHANIRKVSSARFRQMWPNWGLWNKSIGTKAIEHLRKGQNFIDLKRLSNGPSVCFVTHSIESCGGMHYIADIVNQMNSMGWDARVAYILREGKPAGEPIAELRTAPIVFNSIDSFIEKFTEFAFDNGTVIAATSELAGPVAKLCELNNKLTPVLHVQSYEPGLVSEPEISDALKNNFSYIPNVVSSSEWITKEIESLENFKGKVITTISPGVDRDIFHPIDRDLGDERLTVMINLNGLYPFKGADRGMILAQTLINLANSNNKELRILALNVTSITGMPEVLCQGAVSLTRVAKLLATETDLFVDPSLNHSYGMPALEAIACGVPVISWNNKGIKEYLSEHDTVFPNDTSPVKLAEIVYSALFTDGALKKIAKHQHDLVTVDKHDRKLSVDKFIKCLQKNFCYKSERKNIVVVTPHMRKHGGPTTIITLANELAKKGHNVTIATVYSDLNPEVVTYTDLPIILLNQDPAKIPNCDLLITNSDNPLNPSFSKLCPQAKKTIMLKLSHNPRFKQLEEVGLNCKWDAIVTSSQWLADACKSPTTDWNYPSSEAHRIGWFHYNFELMRRSLKRKKFRTLSNNDPVVISTLIHSHPTKGAVDAGNIFAAIKRAHGDKVKLYGVGEIPPTAIKLAIPGMEYVYQPSRTEMADLMFKTDIWLGCSHGEGLGRLALEAMTGVAACVLTDTKSEYAVDGENSLLAPIGDVERLANHVNELLQDVQLRQKIATAGYMTAKAMSDPSDMIDELEKVIANVC